MATLQTCGVCGTLCNVDEVSDHVCLKGYGCYINKAERYFYPLLDDGRTYLCRVYIDGIEKVVQTNIDTTFNQNIPVAGTCQLAISNCSEYEKSVKNVGRKKLAVSSKRKVSKKLSPEEEENLILAVQNRRPLWDIRQLVDQRSRETRKQLWEEVAVELNGK
ncbi:PREDICTED: uncharacterized protein LOC105555803 [Vollenhovia emeryi]|uniref:uncharacterized protein LOC105555803 n=1 Tax=Vollenhovia emeryi TaxID=411798 RepID=UPI0005F53ABE|nr:PREDICTED: uncharacterized protein LOC105555803 [Vollenhovia emeryi]